MIRKLPIVFLIASLGLIPVINAVKPIEKKQRLNKQLSYILGGVKTALGTISCTTSLYFARKTKIQTLMRPIIQDLTFKEFDMINESNESKINFEKCSPEEKALLVLLFKNTLLRNNSSSITLNSLNTLGTGILGIALIVDGIRDIYKTYKQP